MFVKLFQKMLDSSIWLESDSTVRVWVTLLLSMDSDGFCQFASIENLARRARVYPYLVRKAVAILEAPDPQSTTPGDDGRRIERVQGGWIVLNAKKYRDISTHRDLRKSRRLPATPDNSLQLPSTSNITPLYATKAVLEKEVEIEKEVEKNPDFDLIVLEIVNTHPKGKQYRDPIELPPILTSAVVRAVGMDGLGNVREWIKGYAASESAKYAGDPTKCFREFQYRPQFWRNSNANTAKTSKWDQIRALRQADGQDDGELAQLGSTDGSDPREGVPPRI